MKRSLILIPTEYPPRPLSAVMSKQESIHDIAPTIRSKPCEVRAKHVSTKTPHTTSRITHPLLISGAAEQRKRCLARRRDPFHTVFLADGSLAPSRKDDTGRWMPIVPDCIKPKSKLRENTVGPPGTAWNPVIGAWTSKNSSIGTFGYLKHGIGKRRGTEQEDDQRSYRIKTVSLSEQKGSGTAKGSTHSSKPQHSSNADHKNHKSDRTMVKKAISKMDTNPTTRRDNVPIRDKIATHKTAIAA